MVIDSFFVFIGILIIAYICLIFVSNIIMLLACYISCLADKYLSGEVIEEYNETKKYKYDKSPILLNDIVFMYRDNPLETIFFSSIMGILLMLCVSVLLVFDIIRFVFVYIKVQIETNLDTSIIAHYIHNFIPMIHKFFVKLWDKVKNTKIG